MSPRASGPREQWDPEEVRYQEFLSRLASQSSDSRDNPLGIRAADALRLVQAPQPPPGYAYHSRVIYGTAGTGGRPLRLRLYRPVHPGEPKPGVLFIHGGGWSRGFPELHIRHAFDLAAEGFVTATISYRGQAEAKWPAAVQDAKCAVRWMRGHAKDFGLDEHRLAVVGESSGGHLAAMVALTPGRFEGSGGYPDATSAVSAAVLFAPVTDLRDDPHSDSSSGAVQAFLGPDGDDETRQQASPICQVSAQAPPMLVLGGAADPIVPPATLVRFQRRLEQASVLHEVRLFERGGHTFSWHDREGPYRAMLDFLHRHLRAR